MEALIRGQLLGLRNGKLNKAIYKLPTQVLVC